MQENELFDMLLSLYGEQNDLSGFLIELGKLSSEEKAEAIRYFNVTEHYEIRSEEEQQDYDKFIAYFKD